MPITNYTEFFREEKDIYCQNVSSCQVSVMFDLGGGRVESVLFPNVRDPINLTQEIPFAAIKASTDLRKMLNRSPPALRLLTEDEYLAYYNKAAKTGAKSLDEAVEDAERKRRAIRNHQPLPDAPEPMKTSGNDDDEEDTTNMVAEEDVISPRVLHLCLQVNAAVPDQSKMSAQQFLSELETLGELTLQDWEYIQSHGYYKSVVGLAKKQVAKLAAMAVEDDDVKPVKKKAKKQQPKLGVGD